MTHKVEFVPSGRGKARCAPDPDFPHGKAVSIGSTPGDFCKVELPYPAPECGIFWVTCDKCGITVGVTAAGRPDDPVSVEIPCVIKQEEACQ